MANGRWMAVDENLGPHWATCSWVRSLGRPGTERAQLALLHLGERLNSS